MNIERMCYIAKRDRDGDEVYLCLNHEQKPIVAGLNGHRPMLFVTDDEALDAIVKWTSFKGWTIEKVWITGNI